MRTPRCELETEARGATRSGRGAISLDPGRGGLIRSRPGAGEGRLDAAEHGLMHRAAIAEAQFELGRMSIDIDLPRIERQIEHIARMTTLVQHVAKSETHGIAEQAIAHGTR